MARTKAGLSPGARMADFLSASLMARVVPAPAVHEVLDAYGRNSQRIRAFPAVAGVYYAMALSLYPESSYEAVLSAVSLGLAWQAGPPRSARSPSACCVRASAGSRWPTWCGRSSTAGC
ncbi:MAG: transposase domain-containing protein [Burkholderiales bacterium]|nr:transposase domain-containing protein [Burkholderiales bacterium]